METNKGKGNFHYNLSTIYKIKYFYNEFQKTANKNSGVVNCRQTSEMLKKYNSSGLLLKAFMELNHIKRVAPSTYEFKNKSITKNEAIEISMLRNKFSQVYNKAYRLRKKESIVNTLVKVDKPKVKRKYKKKKKPFFRRLLDFLSGK